MQINQSISQRAVLVLYFLLSYNGIQGETKLSKLEDQELEKQLKLLNKPAVKTIKTKYGDTYDCVDFYKQPAFDHPLLKNHNFHPEIKPTLSRIKKTTSGTSTTNSSSTIWLNDQGCPFGTVPIRRITKDDLIRQRYMPPPEDVILDAQLATTSNYSELRRKYTSGFSQGYKRAIVSTLNDPNNKFSGAGMTFSVWNPHVEGQQHSGCRVKIKSGSNILQAGWRVDPTLYGDSKTRPFIHFQAGNMHCFNTLCPGFILVNPDTPIDAPFDKISRRGEKISWEYSMYIDRDIANGNWWLLVEESYKEIGYWPQNIFTDLASFATNVEWGGVAYSPLGVPEPPMGSSFFPVQKTGYDAYCKKITALNVKGETINVKTNSYEDDTKLYKVFDLGLRGKYRHIILYGGPGESA